MVRYADWLKPVVGEPPQTISAPLPEGGVFSRNRILMLAASFLVVSSCSIGVNSPGIGTLIVVLYPN